MTYGLFHRPIHEFRTRKTEEALAAVDRMPEADLLNPNLAGRLEKIADSCCFEVASLRPGERRGKHCKETRQVNDYDRMVNVAIDMIEVTVPFDGPRESFAFSPSSCIQIDSTVLAYDGHLTVRFEDDEQLERNVDIVIERISKNLDQLRREIGQFKAELIATLGKAADDRAAEIKARRERNKKRSFPID